MNNCFIILAAGQSKRFKSKKPKQYIRFKNKPLYQHSIDKVLKSGLFKYIILVLNNKKFSATQIHKSIKSCNDEFEIITQDAENINQMVMFDIINTELDLVIIMAKSIPRKKYLFGYDKLELKPQMFDFLKINFFHKK